VIERDTFLLNILGLFQLYDCSLSDVSTEYRNQWLKEKIESKFLYMN